MKFKWSAKIGSYLFLSILWFIWCVPIFTIGASTTAYCSVMNRLMWDQEGYLVNMFMDAFKSNFKKSTKLWGVMLVPIILSVCSTVIMYENAKNDGKIMNVLPAYIILLGMLWILNCYVFAYNATFEDNIVTIIKNSMIISIANIKYSLLMLILDVAVIAGGYFYIDFLWLFGIPIVGYINMKLLYRVLSFYKTEDKTDAKSSVVENDMEAEIKEEN